MQSTHHCIERFHLPSQLQKLHIYRLLDDTGSDDVQLSINLGHLTALKDLNIATLALSGESVLPKQLSKLVVADIGQVRPLLGITCLQTLELTDMYSTEPLLNFSMEDLLSLQQNLLGLQEIKFGYGDNIDFANNHCAILPKLNLKNLSFNVAGLDRHPGSLLPETVASIGQCSMLTSLCLNECFLE